MKKKTKLITKIILGSVLTLMTGYLIYEASVPQDFSLIHKMTHIKLNEPINDGKVDNLNVINDDAYYKAGDTIYPILYEFYPFDAGNRDVTITSSNPQYVSIVDGGFKVNHVQGPYVSNEPVEIKVTSNENKEASDSFLVYYDNIPCTLIEFSDNNLPLAHKEEGMNNFYTYETTTNSLFNIYLTGYNLEASSKNISNEEIKITHSSNITRVGEDGYYINQNDGKDCYIKASTSHYQLSFRFLITGEGTIKEPEEFILYNKSTPVSGELKVGETYDLLPYNQNEYVSSLPYSLTPTTSNIKMLSNLKFVVLDEGSVSFDIKIPTLETKKLNFEAKHQIEELDFIIHKENLRKNTLKIYENHSFVIDLDFNGGTYKDIKYVIEGEDPSCLVIKDGYIFASKPGKATVKITPENKAYKEKLEKTFDVEVKPLVTTIIFNEDIIFGFIYLIYGVLIGVFFFMFVMNKKYIIYMPIAYIIGLVLTSIVTIIQLASPFRYPTFPLFALFALLVIAGISLIYIGTIVYHSYNGYDLKDKE